MNESYMIDSSAWIQYFRDKDYELTPVIKELIEKDAVHINGIIQTEVLKGAKSEKNFHSLKNSFSGLHFLEIDRRLFDRISNAAFTLRRQGITVPLTDLVIAVQCVDTDLILIENDRHFRLIGDHLDLKRFQSEEDNGSRLGEGDSEGGG